MKRLMCLCVACLVFCTALAIADEGPVPTRDARTLQVGYVRADNPNRDGSCTLALAPDNGTLSFFGWGITSAGDGERVKLWLDPATDQYGTAQCTPPYYPYRVESFDVLFAIYTDSIDAAGYTLCFNVDIECPRNSGTTFPDQANGPGAIRYTQQVCHTVTPEEAGSASGIIEVHVDLTNPVCVPGPFFAGVEFVSWDGPVDPPSVIFNRDPAQGEQNYDVWYYFNFAGLLPCWYTPPLDFGCGTGCNPGAWYFYVNGTAGADCDAPACNPCATNLVGETDADPILITSSQWSREVDLCRYCSNYDMLQIWGPTLGSNTAAGGDVVFELRFPPELPEVQFYILIEPVCSANQHFRLRSWLSDSFGPFDRGTPFFPGVGVPQVYDYTSAGFGPLPNDVYHLYVDVRNCCCPIRVTYVGDQPLPVELRSFDAIAGDSRVTLNWATASESNVSHFEIQRNNVAVDQVRASNNASGSTYSWIDRSVQNGTTYTYKLVGVDVNGARKDLGTQSATPSANIVTEYALNQNYPNPFNPTTTISYALREAGSVTLKVFAVDGREVTTLVAGNQTAGLHTVDFDASNLASGIYLYKLSVNGFTATHKMVLMK